MQSYLLTQNGLMKNRAETVSLEEGPKATIDLVPTEIRFVWKTVDEHLNRETKDGVNTFSEHFQGAVCERTELAHVTP